MVLPAMISELAGPMRVTVEGGGSVVGAANACRKAENRIFTNARVQRGRPMSLLGLASGTTSLYSYTV